MQEDLELEQIASLTGSCVEEDKYVPSVNLSEESSCEESSSEIEETNFNMEGMDMKAKNWSNILLLGFGFLLLFTAFQTTAFVQVG